MSKCPACGYDNPLPPKWLDRLTSIFRKKKPVEAPKNKGCGGGCGSCGDSGTTLADLKSGESGVVDCLKTSDADALDKMMAMSVYPGMRLSVIQASPSCVFQIGRSRFAVDKELAAVVGIKKD
jgi:Fe2+ transport system protein FeoA